MFTPKIAPPGLGSPGYAVTGSLGLVADLLLDVTTVAPPTVGLRYPAGAVVTVTLESAASAVMTEPTVRRGTIRRVRAGDRR
ncbi:hypothetical protein [Actinomadura macra]|uniref:hypothetical protein n=1 Tax=Actinomadura macra TaxID=46164 RepID=UPI000832F79C|nr:hypothetical protein [Actinomadura macra]